MTDELDIHLCTGCGGETLARGLCLDCVADVAAGRPAGTFTATERVFLPSGCDWDLRQAKRVLRGSGVSHSRAQGLARTLVARHWGEIEREARRLYLAGDGRWSA